MNNEVKHINLNSAGMSGMTLVEMVVAALILIASLTVLMLSFSRFSHNAETARRELKAMQVARTAIEQFRSTNYSSISNYAATNLSDSFLLGGQKQCVVVETNDYKTISLAISWISAEGAPRISQTFNTVICNTN